MRGTPSDHSPNLSEYGIIPAYAGNTHTALASPSGCGDHPRICGEHISNAGDYRSVAGSSPHMRGTRKVHCLRFRQWGIIPAYAGNTDSTVSDRDLGRGSSPHMRGTPDLRREAGSRPGIIPAYAGNTRAERVRSPTSRDHPRICGEHEAFGTSASKAQGSSPHMRGTLPFHGAGECIAGIIPAYAGNTVPRTCIRVSLWDHPRICGEHAFGTPSRA